MLYMCCECVIVCACVCIRSMCVSVFSVADCVRLYGLCLCDCLCLYVLCVCRVFNVVV